MSDPKTMRDVHYLITGRDIRGKRFSMKHSNYLYAMGINLYNGNVWRVVDGKRKLIKSVCN
jgi:hypothetical protein